MVLALDHDVVRLLTAAFHRAEATQPRQHRLAEVGDGHQRVERRPLPVDLAVLRTTQIRAVTIADRGQDRVLRIDCEHLPRGAVVIITTNHLGSHPDRMLR